MAAGVNRGLLKVYAEKKTGLLLGAEMCIPQGEHIAHLLALAIDQRLGVNELLRMPFYHPVFEEGLAPLCEGWHVSCRLNPC
jgi:dihydrolipoamide dehydrogenase